MEDQEQVENSHEDVELALAKLIYAKYSSKSFKLTANELREMLYSLLLQEDIQKLLQDKEIFRRVESFDMVQFREGNQVQLQKVANSLLSTELYEPNLVWVLEVMNLGKELHEQEVRQDQVDLFIKSQLKEIAKMAFSNYDVLKISSLFRSMSLKLQGSYGSDFYIYESSHKFQDQDFTLGLLRILTYKQSFQQDLHLTIPRQVQISYDELKRELELPQLLTIKSDMLGRDHVERLNQLVIGSGESDMRKQKKRFNEEMEKLQREYPKFRGFIYDFQNILQNNSSIRFIEKQSQLRQFISKAQERLSMERVLDSEEFSEYRRNLVQLWSEIKVQHHLNDVGQATSFGVLQQILSGQNISYYNGEELVQQKQIVQQVLHDLFQKEFGQQLTQAQSEWLIYQLFEIQDYNFQLRDEIAQDSIDQVLLESGRVTKPIVKSFYNQCLDLIKALGDKSRQLLPGQKTRLAQLSVQLKNEIWEKYLTRISQLKLQYDTGDLAQKRIAFEKISIRNQATVDQLKVIISSLRDQIAELQDNLLTDDEGDDEDDDEDNDNDDNDGFYGGASKQSNLKRRANRGLAQGEEDLRDFKPRTKLQQETGKTIFQEDEEQKPKKGKKKKKKRRVEESQSQKLQRVLNSKVIQLLDFQKKIAEIEDEKSLENEQLNQRVEELQNEITRITNAQEDRIQQIIQQQIKQSQEEIRKREQDEQTLKFRLSKTEQDVQVQSQIYQSMLRQQESYLNQLRDQLNIEDLDQQTMDQTNQNIRITITNIGELDSASQALSEKVKKVIQTKNNLIKTRERQIITLEKNLIESNKVNLVLQQQQETIDNAIIVLKDKRRKFKQNVNQILNRAQLNQIVDDEEDLGIIFDESTRAVLQIESLARSENQQLRLENTDNKVKVEELQKKNNFLDSERQQLQEKIQSQQQLIKELEEQQKQQFQLEVDTGKLQEAQNQAALYEGQLEDIFNQKESVEQELNQLYQQNQQLDNDYRALTQQLQENDQRSVNQMNRIEQLNEEIAQMQIQAQDSEQRKNQKIDELIKQITEAEKQLEDQVQIQEQANGQKEIIEKSKKKQEELKRQINGITAQKRQLDKQNEEIKRKLEELQKQNRELLRENEQNVKQKQEIQQKIKGRDLQIRKLQTQNESQQEELLQKEQDKQKIQQQISEMEQKSQEQKQDIQKQKRQIQRYEDQISQIKEQQQSGQKLIKDLQIKNQGILDNMEEQNKLFEQQISDIQQQKEVAYDAIIIQQGKIKDQELKIIELKDQISQELDIRQKNVIKQRSEIKQIREEIQRFDQINSTKTRAQAIRYESEIAKLTEKLEIKERQLLEFEQQIKTIRQEKEQEQTSLVQVQGQTISIQAEQLVQQQFKIQLMQDIFSQNLSDLTRIVNEAQQSGREVEQGPSLLEDLLMDSLENQGLEQSIDAFLNFSERESLFANSYQSVRDRIIEIDSLRQSQNGGQQVQPSEQVQAEIRVSQDIQGNALISSNIDITFDLFLQQIEHNPSVGQLFQLQINVSLKVILVIDLEITSLQNFESLQDGIIQSTGDMVFTDNQHTFVFQRYGFTLNRDSVLFDQQKSQAIHERLQMRLEKTTLKIIEQKQQQYTAQFQKVGGLFTRLRRGMKVTQVKTKPKPQRNLKIRPIKTIERLDFIEGFDFVDSFDPVIYRNKIPVLNRIQLLYMTGNQFKLLKTLPRFQIEEDQLDQQRVIQIFLGIEGFNDEEANAIESIKDSLRQINVVLQQRYEEQDLHFGTLIRDYQQGVRKLNESFSRLIRRFIKKFFNKQNEDEVGYIDDVIQYKKQGSSFLDQIEHHFSVSELKQIQEQYIQGSNQVINKTRFVNLTSLDNKVIQVRKKIALPFIDEMNKKIKDQFPDILGQNFLLLDALQNSYVGQFEEIMTDFTSVFSQLDYLDREMFYQNYYGVENMLLINHLFDTSNLKSQLTVEEYYQRAVFEQQFQDNFTDKKSKFFTNKFREGIMHNYRGHNEDSEDFFRLGEHLPAKFRSLSNASKYIACSIICIIQTLIQLPIFNNAERSTLEFVYFPQIRNNYYFNFERNMMIDKEEEQLMMHLSPLMNFINIFDKILVDSGVSYSKNHDDFITSKVSAIDTRQSTRNEQDFFIHNQTIIFNNFLEQTVDVNREQDEVYQQFLNKDEIEKQTRIVSEIIFTHLFYRIWVNMGQNEIFINLQQLYDRNAEGLTGFIMRTHPKDGRQVSFFERRIVDKKLGNANRWSLSTEVILEIRIECVHESYFKRDDDLFSAEKVKLRYRSKDETISQNRNRADVVKSQNVVFLKLDIDEKVDDTIQQFNYKVLQGGIEDMVKETIVQIIQWGMMGENSLESIVEIKHDGRIFNKAILYRSFAHMHDTNGWGETIQQNEMTEQEVLINAGDDGKQVFKNTIGDLEYPQLFNTSMGFYLSDLSIKQPYKISKDQVEDMRKRFKLIDSFRVSHMGFNRYMITSTPIEFDDEGKETEQQKWSRSGLQRVSQMVQYYRYFRMTRSENIVDGDEEINMQIEDAKKVAKGIKFFLRDTWIDQFGDDYVYLTDYVHSQIQTSTNFNCGVSIFYSLCYYMIPHQVDGGIPFPIWSLQVEYLQNQMSNLGLFTQFKDSVNLLTENPECLFQELTKMQKKATDKYPQVFQPQQVQVEIFDGTVHVQSYQFIFPILQFNQQRIQQFDKFTIVVWRFHAELFSNTENTQLFLRQMYGKINDSVSGDPILKIDYFPPQTHEERQKYFVKSYEGNKHIIVSYDFETGTVGNMLPYMVVFKLDFFNVDKGKIEMLLNMLKTITQGNFEYYKNELFFYILTDEGAGNAKDPASLCKQFLNIISFMRQNIYKQTKIQVVAHNGGKFDNIILLKFIFEKWGHKTRVLGRLTDLRVVLIEEQNINFIDSLQMTQLGSLNASCGKNGMNLDIEKLDLGETPHLEFWYQYKNCRYKKHLLQYCIHDVLMLSKLICSFNTMMIEMLLNIYMTMNEKSLYEKKTDQIYVLTQSLSGTAFEFFYNYLSTDPIFVINNVNVYLAARNAQRGGRTSVLNYSKQENVHDMDIVSSYPNQMVTHRFATGLKDKINLLPMFFYQRNILPYRYNVNHFSLYGLTFFDLGPNATIGYLPVKCQRTGVLFYPRSWGNSETFYSYNGPNEDAYIYDILLKSELEENLMWVYGFQIATMLSLFCTQAQKKEDWMKLNICFEIEAGSVGNPFKSVKLMFEERKTLKQQGKQAQQLGRKLMMNGLSGQMGMKDFPAKLYFNRELIIDQIDTRNPKTVSRQRKEIKSKLLRHFIDNFGLKTFNTKVGTPFTKMEVDMVEGTNMASVTLQRKFYLPQNKKCRLCHLIGQITARGRDQLQVAAYLLMRESIMDLLYFDTDSIYGFNCKQTQLTVDLIESIPSLQTDEDATNNERIEYKIKIGNELGNFQIYDNPLKIPAKSMRAFGKKMYITRFSDEDDPEQKHVGLKIKGSLKRDIEQNKKVFEQFETLGFATKQQVQWQRKNLQIKNLNIVKTFKLNNHSEFVNEDGSTRPFMNQLEKNIYDQQNK